MQDCVRQSGSILLSSPVFHPFFSTLSLPSVFPSPSNISFQSIFSFPSILIFLFPFISLLPPSFRCANAGLYPSSHTQPSLVHSRVVCSSLPLVAPPLSSGVRREFNSDVRRYSPLSSGVRLFRRRKRWSAGSGRDALTSDIRPDP
jgi:hypothetical protein